MRLSSELWDTKSRAVVVAIVVAVLLLSSLTIDLVPRFHFGDSAVFIRTGQRDYIPDNRSWTYGLTASWTLRSTAQLVALPLAQIFLSWTAFAVLAMVVTVSTNIQFPLTALFLLAGCLEPLGYYWSRSFMSDSPAQSLFVLLSAVLLSRFRLVFRFFLVLIAGFALISLRVVYFPAVATALAAAVAWQFWIVRRTQKKNDPVFRTATDSAVGSWSIALAAIIAANLTYAYSNTYMTRGRTLSTNIGDMAFLVGALSPLMTDELDKTPLTSKERTTVISLTYKNRISNTFNPNGLVPMIRRHFSSNEGARPVMRYLVLESIRQHPIMLAELVLRQWMDYLNPLLVLRNQRAGFLSGAVPGYPNAPSIVLPDSVIRIFEAWNVRPAPTPNLPSRPSAALWYLEMGGGIWSLILSYYATFSVFCLIAVPKKDRTAFLIFVNSFAFLYMATIAFGANQLVTRYLLPLDVPLLCTVAVLVSARRRIPPLASVEQMTVTT
jgi:hypothetical protein